MSEKAIEQFRNMPSTWSEITQFADKLITEILSGEANPLEVELCLKALDEVVEKVRKNPSVKRAVMIEADKYPEKTFDYKGISITKSSRANYDYDFCGDTVLKDLNEQLVISKKNIKAREMILQTGCDAVTGETFNKPKMTETTFLTIKFKTD